MTRRAQGMSERAHNMLMRNLRKTPKEALVAALCNVIEQTQLGPQIIDLIEIYSMQARGASKDECQDAAEKLGVPFHG